MELKIYCDASVKLEKMSNVMEVECNVGDYRIDGDTLTGDIIIKGNYIKDVIEERHEFDEIVPFTIVFNDVGYIVEGITIKDFECQEIINQGIECGFSILVNYTSENGEIEEDYNEDEDKYDNQEEADDEDFIIDELDFAEEIEVETEEDIIAVNDEDIKAEINKKYDNLLNEILEARADDNFLEKKDNVAVRSNADKSDCRGFLNKITDKYSSYRVYYTNNEKELEEIAKKEKIAVDKIYKDNKENEFISKKRIIIK